MRRSVRASGGAAAAVGAAMMASMLGAPAARAGTGEDVEPAGPQVKDREIGARLGLATGGGAGVTPGGLRVSGYYLYQLADVDWFDGTIGFTFGSGGAECFRDRGDELVCDHGAFDGFAGEITGGVRRFVAVRDAWAPYLRASAGLRVISFGDDELRGVAVPLAIGAGLRVRVDDQIAVGADAAFEVGYGGFGRGLGGRAQAGLVVGFSVDFGLN